MTEKLNELILRFSLISYTIRFIDETGIDFINPDGVIISVSKEKEAMLSKYLPVRLKKQFVYKSVPFEAHELELAIELLKYWRGEDYE